MSKATIDNIDALIAKFRDLRTDVMRNNALGIQACRLLEASLPYMDAIRVDPPSSDSATPFPDTAPFVPSGQPDTSSQPFQPAASSAPALP